MAEETDSPMEGLAEPKICHKVEACFFFGFEGSSGFVGVFLGESAKTRRCPKRNLNMKQK